MTHAITRKASVYGGVAIVFLASQKRTLLYALFFPCGNISLGIEMAPPAWVLLIRLENYSVIVMTDGDEAAEELQMRVLLRVTRICEGKGGMVGSLRRGVIAVRWDIGLQGRYMQHEPGHREVLLQEITADLNEYLRRDLRAKVAGQVSVRWELADAVGAGLLEAKHVWPESHFESDVAIADSVYEALRSNRVEVVFEPVCHVRDRAEILYFECLVRIRGDAGELIFPAEFIPALERLRLMRCLDRHVLRHAIALLNRQPELMLGVNISAQSAVDDLWWVSTFVDLLAMPELARRLVVEITETAQMESMAGKRFCQYLQRLGCLVAIDDFGAGFGARTAREIGMPDVIKIDGAMLRNARGKESGEFEEMVSSARQLGWLVVVEGVECEEDLRMAERSGAEWVQGHYLSTPKLLG
ncbi:EAL domain-containing protein [Herbaspirillum rubrisubalbicans]|uniref:EAL domain-containing protein n=1 Tax=Herbaspirillum rubrisubalbicans TaxID=80842 RepID=UPI000DD3CBE8|nr:EAL domain-containing protein [Herbaspirillum rubrisubalbicans]